MKTYTEQEVVELLKKFNRQQTKNVNSDKWYFNWVTQNSETPNINLEKEREQYDMELFKGK
jgi:hypothetical protein